MKRSLAVSALVVLGICLLNENSLGQFKQDAEEKPKVTESIFRNPSSAGLFSWFNPNNFFMRQQLSMSFGSFGGRTGSVAQFTNSMFYKVSNPLDLRVGVRNRNGQRWSREDRTEPRWDELDSRGGHDIVVGHPYPCRGPKQNLR